MDPIRLEMINLLFKFPIYRLKQDLTKIRPISNKIK